MTQTKLVNKTSGKKDKSHPGASKNYKSKIEASLFISGRIMSIEELARVCKTGNLSKIRKTIEELKEEYKERKSGIEIYFIKNSCGMRVYPEIEDEIMHLAPESDMPNVVLKTLALIAYKQPILQSEIVKRRGASAYKYISMLMDHELVHAKREGRSKILTTTANFNKYFQVDDRRFP